MQSDGVSEGWSAQVSSVMMTLTFIYWFFLEIARRIH